MENYEKLKAQKDEIMKSTDLEAILQIMQMVGSSVLLNWGEDTDAWECSWVTGGRRFVGLGRTPILAVRDCQKKERDRDKEKHYFRGADSQPCQECGRSMSDKDVHLTNTFY